MNFLWEFSEQPRSQCRYHWSAGAVAVWDNRCTQHYANFDFDGRRVIHRVAVVGDVPKGEPPRWPAFGPTTRGAAQAALAQRQRILVTVARAAPGRLRTGLPFYRFRCRR